MRIVVALGGNALLRRGEPMTVEIQRQHVRSACEHLARVAADHQLVVSHGNGPRIGLLASEQASYDELPDAPLDVLGAETQGRLGYLIEQELRNRLPFEHPIASLLTMVEVDPEDPAFLDPSEPIGPMYDAAAADRLAAERGWTFTRDGDRLRRVVPSPTPRRIFERRPVEWLLERGCVVICAGGGGIPTAYAPGRPLTGVEAVIDKDHASALLATDVGADLLVLATDAAACVRFGHPDEQAIVRAHPDALIEQYADEFAAGSMLPKVLAACRFARNSARGAVIGRLSDLEAMVAGAAGTHVTTQAEGVELRPTGQSLKGVRS